MKSALERAMERFGGDEEEKQPPLTEEQKQQLTEIDRKYEAKIARARLTADEKSRYLEDPSEVQQLKLDTAEEVRTYEEKKEQEKDKLRQQFRQTDESSAKSEDENS